MADREERYVDYLSESEVRLWKKKNILHMSDKNVKGVLVIVTDALITVRMKKIILRKEHRYVS